MASSSDLFVKNGLKVRSDLFKNMRSSARRNLFGTPDPKLTQKLLEEQERIDKERMIRRWGFDIIQSKFVEINMLEVNKEVKEPKIVPEMEERKPLQDITAWKLQRAKRNLFTNSNTLKLCGRQCGDGQLQITDFWKVSKFVRIEKPASSKTMKTSPLKKSPNQKRTKKSVK